MSLRLPDRRQFLGHSAAALAAAAAFERNLFAAPPTARITGPQLQLANDRIEATWLAGSGGLRLQQVRDLRRGRKLDGAWPVAALTVAGAATDSATFQVTDIRRSSLAPRPHAANFAERLPGRQLSATLRDPAGRFQVLWQATLRQGSHYIRQQLTVTAPAGDLPLNAITLWDLDLPGIAVQGKVKGSPLSAPNGWFFGFEHPLSQSTLAAGRAQCTFARPLPLPAGQSAAYSSVVGAFADGQLRRDFLAYLERERAHPYRPFLHYNSWFDLGYFTPYDQAGCLDVIAAFGTELSHKRGARLSSFLFDDGWDNHKDWGFNAGFPDGFTPLKAATAPLGAGPGVWLSPWGGYGKPRQERLANGRALGYEINREGLALSGPVYYKVFHQACVDMITRYGINQFKLDGTGSTAEVVPGSAFGSDFEAAIHLIGDLRALKHDLFINLTTGTYPSPFWLRYADSTWRGGYDTNFAGVGTDRQQWITYRDGATRRGVVERGPLYPLNSLMLHGIVFAKHARRLTSDPGHDFDAEVRSYFGTGTQLQEMYISHDLLQSADWDVLAEAANWAGRNAATLMDSHWVGGDPAQLEAYGHAAWSPRNATLCLRNPSDKPQTLELDPAEAFELPASAPDRLRLRSPFARDQWRRPDPRPTVELRAGEKHAFNLNPFEVLTLDARE